MPASNAPAGNRRQSQSTSFDVASDNLQLSFDREKYKLEAPASESYLFEIKLTNCRQRARNSLARAAGLYEWRNLEKRQHVSPVLFQLGLSPLGSFSSFLIPLVQASPPTEPGEHTCLRGVLVLDVALNSSWDQRNDHIKTLRSIILSS